MCIKDQNKFLSEEKKKRKTKEQNIIILYGDIKA